MGKEREIVNETNRRMLQYTAKNEGVMFTHDDLAKFVIEQGQINKSLSDSMKSLSTDFREIKESMKNQEVLLEKFSNLTEKIDDNNKRVHKRIDKIDADYKNDIKELREHLEKEIDEMKSEHISPIKNSLDWAWKFIFSKMFMSIIMLITVIYNLKG